LSYVALGLGMRPIDVAWSLLKAADFADEGVADEMRSQANLWEPLSRDNPDPLTPGRMPIQADIPINVAEILADEDLREAIYGKRIDGPEVGEVKHRLEGQRPNYSSPGEITDFKGRYSRRSQPRTDIKVRGGYPSQEYPMSPRMFPPEVE